jgi:hypothetical protein
MNELLILHGPNRSRLRAEVNGRFHVVQEISPYVMEVADSPRRIMQFAEQSEDGVWLASNLAQRELTAMDKELSPMEHFFVDAWRQRSRRAKDKKRIGDGLPWDTPGFEPP